MTILATALLLASSLALSSPGYVEQSGVERNPMLRNAAVDHDLAKVRRRFERELRSDSTDSAVGWAKTRLRRTHDLPP